ARRRAPAALAEALTGDPRAADERAWHRALGAVAPDAAIADDLACSAEHQPPGAAAAALARAAWLTPDRPLRARRLLAAADAANRAGEFEASASLAEAAEADTSDVVERATAERLIALSEIERDRLRDALERLARAADEVVEIDPVLAARILVEAIEPCSATSQMERGARLGRRARRLARGADAVTRLHIESRYADSVRWAGRAGEATGPAPAAGRGGAGGRGRKRAGTWRGVSRSGGSRRNAVGTSRSASSSRPCVTRIRSSTPRWPCSSWRSDGPKRRRGLSSTRCESAPSVDCSTRRRDRQCSPCCARHMPVRAVTRMRRQPS